MGSLAGNMKERKKFGKFCLVGTMSVVICRRETVGEGIIEGNRSQETGHNPRLIPGTHSLLGGQGRGVSKTPLKFFHFARESNPGSLGCKPSVLTTVPRSPLKERNVSMDVKRGMRNSILLPTNIWVGELDMEWGAAVEDACCSDELPERSVWR